MKKYASYSHYYRHHYYCPCSLFTVSIFAANGLSVSALELIYQKSGNILTQAAFTCSKPAM